MTKHEKVLGVSGLVLAGGLGAFFYLQSKEAARLKSEDEQQAARKVEFREAEGRRELEAANNAWRDEAPSRKAAEAVETQQDNSNDSIVPCGERGSANSEAYLVAREDAADNFNSAVSRMSSIEPGSAQFQAIGKRKNMLVMLYTPRAESVANKFFSGVMADRNVVHDLCIDAFQKVASVEQSATGRLRLMTVYAISAGGAVRLLEEEVFKLQIRFENSTK